jgi:transcription elongation factor Elf1
MGKRITKQKKTNKKQTQKYDTVVTVPYTYKTCGKGHNQYPKYAYI